MLRGTELQPGVDAMNSVCQITKLLALPVAMAIFILAAQSAGDLSLRTEVPFQIGVVLR